MRSKIRKTKNSVTVKELQEVVMEVSKKEKEVKVQKEKKVGRSKTLKVVVTS